MLAAVEGAIEVGLKHSMPALGRDVFHSTDKLPASVVDQKVQFAQIANRILHQSLDLRPSMQGGTLAFSSNYPFPT